ncbi:MAG: hypothetical protein J7J72_01175 [Bacteroidales bacterium]|nr:hypothetical protein [Bacteroidales bacterium]
MISSIEEYEELSKSLGEKGFNKVDAPWTFYSAEYNAAIDILPFGQIEEQNTVQFNDRNIDLHVLGLKEVLEQAIPIPIEEKIANIPPLPGMIVLKLVAWSDRPEERGNDLPDILRIIEHYFDIEYDEIIEFHYDTFPEDEIDQLIVAAEVLGRKAKIYLDKSEILSKRIHHILDTNLGKESESYISRVWAIQKNWEIEYAFSILQAFKNGLLKE